MGDSAINTNSTFNDPFAGAAIIDAYTDEDALREGTLIDMSSVSVTYRNKPINRITSTAINELLDIYGTPCEEDDEYEREVNLEEVVPRILANITHDDGVLAIASIDKHTYWIAPNETGGLTLMKSEDY